MSKRTIPETVQVTCDRCGTASQHSHKLGAEASITRSVGEAAGCTRKYDLCDKCVHELEDWMDAPKNVIKVPPAVSVSPWTKPLPKEAAPALIDPKTGRPRELYC